MAKIRKCVICGTVYHLVDPGARALTCSDKCHEDMKDRLIKHYGLFKKVTNRKGESFRVPLDDIIEKGLREEELSKYPRWEDQPKGGT
jgi:hypothetical protein